MTVHTLPPQSTHILFRVYLLLPVLGCLFAVVLSPLLAFDLSDEAQSLGPQLIDAGDPGPQVVSRVENRIVWPLLAAFSVILTVRYRDRFAQISIPPSVFFLFAYMAVAGASVFWAFDSEIALRRYLQQVMILTAIVVPTLLSARGLLLTRHLFGCFALATVLNYVFAAVFPPDQFGNAEGYLGDKNTLGQVQALALLFALHECSRHGWRRVQGFVIALIALSLLVASNSRTSAGLALLTPFVGALVIVLTSLTRISPAIVLAYLSAAGLLCFTILSDLFTFDIYDLSVILFGDPTFTGRTTIWAWAAERIASRPLLGWGYQSFWEVGPTAPSVLEAPGWVAEMPHAHNGYIDVLLETGWIGLSLLVGLILTAVHGVGSVAVQDPRRAWLAMSCLLFVILHNGLETTWVRSYNISWLVFVILVNDRPAPMQRRADFRS